jgi:hypothetical protein
MNLDQPQKGWELNLDGHHQSVQLNTNTIFTYHIYLWTHTYDIEQYMIKNQYFN